MIIGIPLTKLYIFAFKVFCNLTFTLVNIRYDILLEMEFSDEIDKGKIFIMLHSYNYKLHGKNH